MATDARDLDFSTNSDVAIRAWGSGISQALRQVGLLAHTDTGQVDWATVVRPAGQVATEVMFGYEMYRFADALQATAPVFIKIEYGFTVAGALPTYAAGPPHIYVTVGTGTDGVGNLTGLKSARTRLMGNVTPAGNVATAGNSVASAVSPVLTSGDGSYVMLALGVTNQPQATMSWLAADQYPIALPAFLVIERSRDPGGVPTANGLAFLTSGWFPTGAGGTTHATAPTSTALFFSFTNSILSEVAAQWPISWPGNVFTTSANAGDVWTYPMRIVTPRGEYGISSIGTFKGDFSLGTILSMYHFGATRTYRALSGIAGTTINDNTRSYTNTLITNGALLMRWE